MNSLDSITVLKGVGPKKADALKKLGIYTLGDLVYTFPRGYEDRRNVCNIADLRENQAAVFVGTVETVVSSGYRGGGFRRPTKMLVSDDTGSIELVFFNSAYLAKTIKSGNQYVFYGKPTLNRGKLQIIHPDFSGIKYADFGILPVYPLVSGISQKDMRKIHKQVEPLYGSLDDILSQDTIERNNLCSLEYAIRNMHAPEDKQKLLEAKYRLIFDEFMVLQTGLAIAKNNSSELKKGIAFDDDNSEDEYINSLPYNLTGAQRRCTNQIMADLVSDKRMNRLVQGDVGSGKTVIAEIAMFKAFKSGYQSVMMAPTEILAKQHYEELTATLSGHGVSVGFLSGSMKAAERREVLAKLKDGSIQVVTGTHALIQPDVEYKNLGLVITDEQHRFGVAQRMRLKDKGDNPNVLVMTATPIPRTLAVILYGDLDVSVVDELPPGRKAIETKLISGSNQSQIEEGRNRCYNFVEKQLAMGHQAYVVAPLIDESEVMDIKSAIEIQEELSQRFKGYKVGLVHGAMKQAEKDQIMELFHKGQINVLVATVVIEVGINVPNATVMVIENSERFGLAQLHQLRGRVGRGKDKSYCFLINAGNSEVSVQRGKIMEASSDGFYIAEEDLKLRGPGEIFGTRQHGIPDLRLADLARHLDVMELVKTEVARILEDDPTLKKEENKPLKMRIESLFGKDYTLDL
ncbi:MAG: ATP-dependent DNA helicase RecG [Firmicutes bacterium]|nr:ATP-dependent DNA helicase RecG [Bacillota bacterium]